MLLRELKVTLGDVRDGAAALDHFAQALASRRVGPRVLADSIPEVARGIAPLCDAISALSTALAARLPEDSAHAAFEELVDHTLIRLHEVEGALSGRGDFPVDARERLAIEAIVKDVAAETAAFVHLAGVLVSAATPQVTWIDLREALSERRPKRVEVAPNDKAPAKAPKHRFPTITAHVEAPSHLPMEIDPQLFLGLLDRAVTIAARAAVGSALAITAGYDPGGALLLNIRAAAPPAPSSSSSRSTSPFARRDLRPKQASPAPASIDVAITLWPELPRELDVVRAAAKLGGFELRVEAAGARVMLLGTSKVAGSPRPPPVLPARPPSGPGEKPD